MDLNYIVIFLVLVLSIIEIYEKKGKRFPPWVFQFIIILTISVAILQIIITNQEEKIENYSKNSGQFLKSESDAQVITYKFGSNVTLYGSQNQIIYGRNGAMWPGNCDKELLSSKIENNEFKISASLYDKDDNIVVKIESNEWTVNPKYMWDKNFDSNAFEVIDDKGNVEMQIEKNGTVVMVRGDFYCNGHRDIIDDNGIFGAKTSDKSMIRPLFRYPSLDHPSERIKI